MLNAYTKRLQNQLNHFLNLCFYTIKPAMPRPVQIAMRRWIATYKKRRYRDMWPIDPSTSKPPEGWTGWPEGKRFALSLSHDVESAKGYGRVLDLARIEQGLGFRSTFNFVPEAYGTISPEIMRTLKEMGFGIGVHGLKHDGKLFLSRRIFDARVPRINHYLKRWGTEGFSSPSMHHNLEWLKDLKIEYSISTFDTDPFEPQPDASGTIFPIWIPARENGDGIVELPLTMPQDFTLFVILREETNKIWKEKLDWIARQGGMVILNTHPDYMSFSDEDDIAYSYPIRLYTDFIGYVKEKYQGKFYNAQPKDLAAHYRRQIIARKR